MEAKKGIRKILFAVGIMLFAAICGIVASIAAMHYRKQTVVLEFPDSASASESEEKGVNILFLGADRQAGLCDVMMLANIKLESGHITVAHIPRDTYARYTSNSYKKLNGAYNTLGGAEDVADFLSDAFDIRIEHFVCMGLDTVADIVDAVGGVEVNIPEDMKYSDPEAGLYIDLKAGTVLLDGEKAEQFLRYRSGYADGDLGRIEAQKLFVGAFFNKLVNEINPIMATKICAAAEGIETDMTLNEWLHFGLKTLSLAGTDVKLLTLPGEHVTATKSGASYYCLSAPSNAQIMELYFGGEGAFDRYEQFRNKDYTEFENAYNTQKDYSLTSIQKIVEENVNN